MSEKNNYGLNRENCNNINLFTQADATMSLENFRNDITTLKGKFDHFKEHGLSDAEIVSLYKDMGERQKKLLFLVLNIQKEQEFVNEVQRQLHYMAHNHASPRSHILKFYNVGLSEIFKAGYDMSYDIALKNDFATPYSNDIGQVEVQDIEKASTKKGVKAHLSFETSFPGRRKLMYDLPIQMAEYIRSQDTANKLASVDRDVYTCLLPHKDRSLEQLLSGILLEYIKGNTYKDIYIAYHNRSQFFDENRHITLRDITEGMVNVELVGTEHLRYTVNV